MKWLIDRDEWMGLYKEIRKKLPLNFDRDQYATDLLSSLLANHPSKATLDDLPVLGDEVAVFGCGERLATDVVKYLETYNGIPVIAADGSVEILMMNGITPSIVATDLDGGFESIRKAGAEGSILIVHAHGDNIERIASLVPLLSGKIVGSTQVEPRPYVYNFGGFTDGDRAAFIARALGAKRVLLFGFDFDNPSTCNPSIRKNLRVKKIKLEIARYLLLNYLAGKGVEVRIID
ncbi:6-hydroxymethylpterin diphosphokinase MptE-like protein [Thermogladius sp. 4427co]|uniref:6-hydroxymethylpterin diphosphokinase MptE-like protein n=1 Tax=Thermogladius sp. 4427co TaxID=3450718 RepID=UPI003F795FEA